ncbi:MAG: hypothetical protein ABNH53_06850 [Henriciella sp.]|jgi:hypothetical protein
MFDDYDEPNPIWLLSIQVTVIEAALLIIGIEPQGTSQYVEGWEDSKKPRGYLAARNAVESAVQKGLIEGSINHFIYENEQGGYETDHMRYDYSRSYVDLHELRVWMKKRHFGSGFLAIADDKQSGFRDKSHPRYSAKLAAVVEAWEAYDEESNEVGRPKQRLARWLRLNAARFGFTNEEGLPTETVVDDLAKVANWDTGGGAPKSSDGESGPDL